jgi:hypothetical protein
MPRAAHGVPDHQPLTERAAVVGAARARGEHLLAPADEQHGFVLDMADERRRLGQLLPGDPRGEIGTSGWFVVASHIISSIRTIGSRRAKWPDRSLGLS